MKKQLSYEYDIMIFDTSETPEEFWYANLQKYQQRESDDTFPQNLVVTSLVKVRHKDVALFKGHLKDGDQLLIIYPTLGGVVKNFIGIAIADREYSLDNNVEIYELTYKELMTDDYIFDLLVKSHGWVIKDYGDLSGY